MRTEDGDSEYLRLVKLLGENHFTPAHPDILIEKAIDRVNQKRKMIREKTIIPGFLLDWTMVGWARMPMAVFSLALVVLFAYQQHEIMSGIRDIRSRMKEGSFEVTPSATGGVTLSRMAVMTVSHIGPDSIRVAAHDIERLIESYNELEMSWYRIIKVLERNPQLLRRIEREYGASLENLKHKPKI
ncbi:MAG: hypothetical protein R6W67_05025 [Bacteroidales bacterium]